MASKYYDKDKNKEAQSRYRRTYLGTIHSKFHGAKRRSKEKSQSFTITIDYLKELWLKQKGLCALTGVEMGFVGSGWCSASIDRINSDRGYTPQNVQWTCWRPNEAKMDMTNDDFINMCLAVANTFLEKHK